MKVIKAEVLGFCMGVRRAVETAIDETRRAAPAAKDSKTQIYTFGPLIHNPKVLAELESRGIKIIDESSLNSADNESASVIIRAHGVAPDTEKKLRSIGYHIIDATCPNVKRNQLKTQELSRAGYSLFLAGVAEHAEITGLLGYAKDAPFCKVTGSAEEAQDAAAKLYTADKAAKTALLGQTTISENEYGNISMAIKKYFPALKIEKTICAAATERQNALRNLLPQADAVIIAGGRESANTRRLLAIAKESGKPCILCESASDIPDDFRKYKTTGICAGASTPDSIIDDIENKLLS